MRYIKVGRLGVLPVAIIMFIAGFTGCNPFVKNIKEISNERLDSIKLPDGFKIALYASDVNNARSMAMGENGTLFVGSRSAGNVYAILDTNNDFRADETIVIASGLKSPNGVAFREGALYVAEINRIIMFPEIETYLQDPPQPVIVTDTFPDDWHHGWKYIAFGPDDKLYVPVGAPCNNCLSEEPIYATITRMNPDGSEFEIFAEGIRNTVGFDWHPESDVLWFTENGRDWMGDNQPPDELNRAPEPGMHFGYPFCHGEAISDPKFGDQRDCKGFIPPVQELGPHVAALGMLFYTGTMFPENYKSRIFIAEHGSWNRTTPIGYRITQVEVSDDESATYSVFAEGWLQNGRAWGRPVDVIQLQDGSIIISDDHADAIYRIFYEQE